jgi:hypothetical protein
MPVTYEIDKTKQIIRTRCAGNVTFEEVIGHFPELERDPDCPDRLDVLLDLSDLASLPQSDQLRAVSHEIDRVRGRVRFDACAIVASKDAVFGIARVFEVFAEEGFRVTRVFRTVDEAEAWLASQQSPAA